MTKHTPGPWTVTDNSWEVSTVYDAAGNPVAECRIDSDVTEETQDRLEKVKTANAHFIAAAPDLLKALEAVNLARHSDDPKDWQRATELTDAAFAKVEGRT